MRANDLFKEIADDFLQARIHTLDGAPFERFEALLAEWRDPPERSGIPELALFYDGVRRRVVAAPLAASEPHLLYLDFNCYCAGEFPPNANAAEVCRAHLRQLAAAMIDSPQWALPSNRAYLAEAVAFAASIPRFVAVSARG